MALQSRQAQMLQEVVKQLCIEGEFSLEEVNENTNVKYKRTGTSVVLLITLFPELRKKTGTKQVFYLLKEWMDT